MRRGSERETAAIATGRTVRNHGVKTGRALRVSSFGKGTRRMV
jgi:hypothetical protein